MKQINTAKPYSILRRLAYRAYAIVRYSKKKRKGKIIVSVPKKFVGYSANILLYPKRRGK